MGYVLSTAKMRLVKRNDRGNIVKRSTFKRGDEVTKDAFEDPDRFDALVASGALVPEDDYDEPDYDESESEDHLDGEGTGTDGTSTGTSGSGAEPDGDPDKALGGDDEDDPDVVDEFSSMPYPELQKAAKERTGDGSGSAEDLRARLREHAGTAS